MTKDITSYKMACIVARFLDEKIAKDITILNISNVSSFADYFVICSAGSNTQVKALTENGFEIIEKLNDFTDEPAKKTSERVMYVCKNVDSIQAKHIQGEKI